MINSGEVPLWDIYATARLFHSEPTRTSVALFTEPPEGAETVTGILRAQSFAEGTRPHPDAVGALLAERYGPPAETTSEGAMVWFGAEDPGRRQTGGYDPVAADCFNHQRIRANNAAQRLGRALKRFDEAGRSEARVPWADAAGRPWPSAEAVLLDLRDTFTDTSSDPAKCTMLGGVLIAVMPTDKDGLVRSLQIALSDPAEAARLGAANEQRMIEAPAAAGAPLEIKL
jgi:hypothetical protein